jgi:hypothetical protein
VSNLALQNIHIIRAHLILLHLLLFDQLGSHGYPLCLFLLLFGPHDSMVVFPRLVDLLHVLVVDVRLFVF